MTALLRGALAQRGPCGGRTRTALARNGYVVHEFAIYGVQTLQHV